MTEVFFAIDCICFPQKPRNEHLSPPEQTTRKESTTDLDPDDLDRLVPAPQRSSDGTRRDPVPRAEFLVLGDAPGLADGLLGETSEPHAGAPVGALAHGDGVDALVDPGDASGLVHVAEDLPAGRKEGVSEGRGRGREGGRTWRAA